MAYTKEERAKIYREYCQAIANKSGLTGERLSEQIRAVNRRLYKALGHSESVRQRNMNEQELDTITEMREATIELMTK